MKTFGRRVHCGTMEENSKGFWKRLLIFSASALLFVSLLLPCVSHIVVTTEQTLIMHIYVSQNYIWTVHQLKVKALHILQKLKAKIVNRNCS